MNDTKTEPPANAHFARVLALHRGGQALSDLSEQLAKVCEAVARTGKAGTLTLKLDVTPAGRGGLSCLVLEDDIRAKVPAEDLGGSIFFADDQGNLHREDPRQREFELRPVEGQVRTATEEIKTQAVNQ